MNFSTIFGVLVDFLGKKEYVKSINFQILNYKFIYDG